MDANQMIEKLAGEMLESAAEYVSEQPFSKVASDDDNVEKIAQTIYSTYYADAHSKMAAAQEYYESACELLEQL